MRASQELKPNNMKLTTAQLVARLEYASVLCSWLNVHALMKPAMAGLMKRGLASRRQSDEAFTLTEEGEDMLKANKAMLSGGYHDASGVYVPTVVEGAKYWTDEWNQKIPA